MPLFYATVEEVLETITSMNKLGDINDNPANFLKYCSNFIADKLCNIFDLWIDQGVMLFRKKRPIVGDKKS